MHTFVYSLRGMPIKHAPFVMDTAISLPMQENNYDDLIFIKNRAAANRSRRPTPVFYMIALCARNALTRPILDGRLFRLRHPFDISYVGMLSQIQDSTDEAPAALRLKQCSQLQRFAQPLPAAHALAVDQLVERPLLSHVQIRSSFHHVNPSFPLLWL